MPRRAGRSCRIRRTLNREYPPVVQYILSLEGKTKCNRKEHKLLLTYINEHIKGTFGDKYWRLYVQLKLYKELEEVKSLIDDYCGYMPWWDEHKNNTYMTSCGLIILRYYDFNLLFMKETNFDYLFPYFALLRGCVSDRMFEEIKPKHNICTWGVPISQKRCLTYDSNITIKLQFIDDSYYLFDNRLSFIKHKMPPSTALRINNYYGSATYIGILPKDIRVIIDFYIKDIQSVMIGTEFKWGACYDTYTYPNVLGEWDN